jgi:cytochrome b561
MKTSKNHYSLTAKLIHLGLAGFGITAYLTAELAEGGSASAGYMLHAYLGLSLAAVMLLRLGSGLGRSQSLGFRHWRLFSAGQWRQVGADLKNLVRLKVPEGGRHQGLAGLVQAFGLMLFTWMAATGTGLYILDGASNHSLFELVEEAHELGEGLIPLYLLLHVGAVILHTLVGQPVWRRMFHFGH